MKKIFNKKPQVVKTLIRVSKIIECIAANDGQCKYQDIKKYLGDGSQVCTRILNSYKNVCRGYNIPFVYTSCRSVDKIVDIVISMRPDDMLATIAAIEKETDVKIETSTDELKKLLFDGDRLKVVGSQVASKPSDEEKEEEEKEEISRVAGFQQKFLETQLALPMDSIDELVALLEEKGVKIPESLKRLAEIDKEREELLARLKVK